MKIKAWLLAGLAMAWMSAAFAQQAPHVNIEQRLTPEQMRAVELIAYNEEGRSYRDIAAEIGVHETTLIRWRAKPDFNRAINDISEELMESFLSDAYRSLRKLSRTAKSDGSKLKALELILKNRGRLKDVQDVTAHVTDERTTDAILEDVDNLKERLGLMGTGE